MRAGIFIKAAELLDSEEYKKKHSTAVKEEIAGSNLVISGDMANSIRSLRESVAAIAELKGESAPSRTPGGYLVVQRRAMGVM